MVDTFYCVSIEHPSKIVLQLANEVEFKKIKPPTPSNVALWPGSVEGRIVPTLGRQGVSKPWYFLLTLPGIVRPVTLNGKGGWFLKIMETAFTCSSLLICKMMR